MEKCTICDSVIKPNFDLLYWCNCIAECKYCYLCFSEMQTCPFCYKTLQNSVKCNQVEDDVKKDEHNNDCNYEESPYYYLFDNESINLSECASCTIYCEDSGNTKCSTCNKFVCYTCFDPNIPYCIKCVENIKRCTKCKDIIMLDSDCYRCDNCIVDKVDYFCGECSFNLNCEHCSGLLNSVRYYQCTNCKTRLHKKNGCRYICTCNSIHIDTKCYRQVFICSKCNYYNIKCPNCPLIINDNISFVSNKQGLCVPRSLYNACIKEYGYFYKPTKNNTKNNEINSNSNNDIVINSNDNIVINSNNNIVINSNNNIVINS